MQVMSLGTHDTMSPKIPPPRVLQDEPASIYVPFRVQALAVSPNGELLAVFVNAQKIELWSAVVNKKPRKLGELLENGRHNFERLAFTSDSRELIAASSGGEIRRWDVSRWLPAQAELEPKTEPKPIVPGE
jgi:hypothetical protein